MLRMIPAADQVVRLAGSPTGLELWFKGPRHAGDFLAQWCVSKNDLSSAKLRTLSPPPHYIAVDPDDMLAIQEWHMANEGLDTESICPRCRSTGIQPITTTADHRPCGNPQRAIRFFCAKCLSVHDESHSNRCHPVPCRCRSCRLCVRRCMELFPPSASWWTTILWSPALCNSLCERVSALTGSRENCTNMAPAFS